MKPESSFVSPRAGSSSRALLPGRGEVLLGERQHRGLPGLGDPVDLGQLVERDRDRPVGVGADAEPVVVLAVVEVLVLVAQDRQAGLDGLVGAADEVGDLPGERVLVRERQQRHAHADHRTELLSPEPRAAHDDVRRELARVGHHPGDAPGVMGDGGDAHRPVEHRPAALGAPDQRGDRAGGLGQPVGGGVQATEDPLAVEQRVQPRALLDVDDLGGHAPRGGPPLLAVQVGEALGGRRDLEAADLVEAPVTVARSPAELEELLDGVAREPAHRPGRIGLEDEAGGVGRGAAGQVQRPLVEDGDAVPPAGGELVGEVRADDPGSDDDDAGCGAHASALCRSVGVGRNSTAASRSQSAT